MSTNNGNADSTGNNDGKTPGSGDGAGTPAKFESITTQEALDKIIGARIYEERAKFKDYEDLKSKATKFDEMEEANKTELEKLAEKVAKQESEIKSYKAKNEISGWRAEVRKEKGIPESMDPLLTGSTLEEIKAQADLIVANMSGKKAPVIKSDKGSNSEKGSASDMTGVLNELLGGN